MKRYLEVCIDSVDSGTIAEKAGADRVELCDNLYEGGTTPSLGTIRMARKSISIPINIIIRPRGGDFLYNATDYNIIIEDIKAIKAEGINGIVIGMLLPDGHIDIDRMKEVVNLARPMSVTFHRAFDMTPEPFVALEEVIATGADRLLTSAHGNMVFNDAKLIKELISRAKGRIIIMPGAGINENNIADIINKTDASEYHITGRKIVDSKMVYRKEGIYMGGLAEIPEFTRKYADHATITKMRDILDSYN
jgi:copper homeostasis protein